MSGAVKLKTESGAAVADETARGARVLLVDAAGNPYVAGASAGGATEAKQDVGNASLASVDGKLPALEGGRIPVVLPAGGSGLTDAELRASPVPVSGPLTDAQLGARALATEATLALIQAKTDNLDVALSTRAVTGLTDAQLRASNVNVAVNAALPAGANNIGDVDVLTYPGPADAKFPALTGSGRIPVELPAGGSGLTDAELRASAVPITGVTQVRDLAGTATDVGYRSADLPMPVNQTPAGSTYTAYADAVAFAGNKHHLSIFNAVGSGKVLRLRKLFAVNLQSAAVTGVFVRFDAKRTTAVGAGGTVITPQAHDSSFAALPAGVTVATGRTPTEGALLFPWITSTDEETAVPGLSKTTYQQAINIMFEGSEIHTIGLREGEGFTLKQITASTVGSFGWILVFTAE